MLDLKPDEKIAAFVPVKEFDDRHFIVAVTKLGVINKQPLSSYSNVRRDGINAISLDENDYVIECKLTSGDNDIILGTRGGQAVRFHESAARELGRNTRGVRGITLKSGDEVVGMIIVNENDDVLTVTEKGYGKRTPVSDYRKTNRGGSGIINIKVTEKNGPVVALKGVYRDGDVMLVTRNGIIIRSAVGRISVIGRNTQGVRLISLDDGDHVIDVAMCEKEEDGETAQGDTTRQIENPQLEPEDLAGGDEKELPEEEKPE
jgi:DNA gyrase subunit A